MVNLKRVLLPIGILVIAVVLLGMMAGMKPPPEKKEETSKPLLVATETVTKQDIHYDIGSQGTVRPKVNSMLVTEVNGRVIEVADNFVAGGFFNKDDVIIRIDPSDYQTAVKTAKANLARAEATLQEEKARAKVAEKEWNEYMEGTAPELYLRKPQLARELANVRSAQASLETAERDLRRTVIRAPFDVMIKQKNTEVGQFVTRGASLGSVYGTEIAEVRLPLSDADISYIDMPRPDAGDELVEVTLVAVMAGKIRQWQGQIVRSEGVVDEKSRVTYAVVELKDPYGLKATDSDYQPLVFGRFVKAQVKGRLAKNVAIVPRHVLTRDNHIILVKDNKIEIRDIDIVRMDENAVYVANGIEDGDDYVTTAIPNPMNGMEVRTQVDEAINDESQDEQTSLDAIAQAGQ